MNKSVFEYICRCEGWKTAIKSLHWNADSLSQHKLCDDIADRLSDFQDQVSEVEQSISGKLPFNKLKGTTYKITDLKTFVEDVINRTTRFHNRVKKLGKKYIGMASDCESFLSDMQRNLYLVNFTIKEDFKRSYRRKLNEGREISGNRISENELSFAIHEAVRRALSRKLNESCNEIGDTVC